MCIGTRMKVQWGSIETSAAYMFGECSCSWRGTSTEYAREIMRRLASKEGGEARI